MAMCKLTFLLPTLFISVILLFMPSQGLTKTFISGQVLKVNTESRILILRVSGKSISLDISNPSFTGYRGIHEIKTGDWVKIVYYPSGVKVLKSSGKLSMAKQEERIEKKDTKKDNRFARFQRVRTPGNSFRDVDNDHDGRITPVELSVVMPGLTMQRFREYDKNNDGYLDASEYLVAIKNR